jgi:hypothetical protein
VRVQWSNRLVLSGFDLTVTVESRSDPAVRNATSHPNLPECHLPDHYRVERSTDRRYTFGSTRPLSRYARLSNEQQAIRTKGRDDA